MEPKLPKDLSPSRYFPGAGWGILRSDLEDENGFLLAVRAGHNAMSHRHFDLGSIILRSRGRGLIIDSGLPEYSTDYWRGVSNYKRNTIGHNCILVDGKGQGNGEENRAEITRLQDFGNTKYLCVDVRCPSNNINLHRRQISVELDQNGTDKLMIEDEVRLSKKAKVSWQFHFEKEAKVQDKVICIKNDPVSLAIEVNSPDDFNISIERDYPVPFAQIETSAKGNNFTLKLACKIRS